jgi:hypothetical protein
MMLIPGKATNRFFYVRSQSGGILSPDAPPVGTLIRGAIDTTVPVTITAAGDGGWIASATIPADWAQGDPVSLRVSATSGDYPMSQTFTLGTVAIDQQLAFNNLEAIIFAS